MLGQFEVEVTSFTKTVVTAPPQASVAATPEGLGAGTGVSHEMASVAGQVTDEGGAWSSTSIVCVQVAVKPHASVTI